MQFYMFGLFLFVFLLYLKCSYKSGPGTKSKREKTSD